MRVFLGKKRLDDIGFSSAQQRPPGFLIPLHGTDGSLVWLPIPSRQSRVNAKGRPIKYENPASSSIRLDCPPCCTKALSDPKTPLWITEGSKKADALVSQGACAISLAGVWGFKGKNEFGGITMLAYWDYITLKDRLVTLLLTRHFIDKSEVKKALQEIGSPS